MNTPARPGPLRIADKMSDYLFVSMLPRSRADAAAAQSKFYIGKPCKHGHNSYRLTVNGGCAQCASIRSAKTPTKDQPGRKKVNARWNSSEGAKTAKDRWKAKNPKWAWVVSAVGGARTRSRFSNTPFSITNEYVASIAGDTCPVLGIPLMFGGTGRPVAGSASIDRIVPELGYVEGNVAVISYRANVIKSNASAAEVRRVADWMDLVAAKYRPRG
jgi:hypothetical protein